MNASKTTTDRLSWWVGLTREELTRAIAEREDYFRNARIPILDTVGARMLEHRDSWEPRRPKASA